MPYSKNSGHFKSYSDRGRGYGGFVNHAFSKAEAEKLGKGESVVVEGIRSNKLNKYYDVTVKYDGMVKGKDGRERPHVKAESWKEVSPEEMKARREKRVAMAESHLSEASLEAVNQTSPSDLPKERIHKEEPKAAADTAKSTSAAPKTPSYDDDLFSPM